MLSESVCEADYAAKASYCAYRKEASDVSLGSFTFQSCEAYFVYLKKFSKKEAEQMYEMAREMVVPIDDSIIKEAMELKLFYLKKRLSFADCIGYVTALKLSAKFVTGDYTFKGMENVEFVK